MRAVDTNAVVRLLARDDAAQAERVDDYIEGGAWVSHLVLAESIWVFDKVYGAGRAQLVGALTGLLGHDRLSLEDPSTVRAALEHFKSHPKVSFSDCLILEIARKAGHTPLGTFDKALGKIEGARAL